MMQQNKYKKLIEAVENIISSCRLCPHQCKVNRQRNEKGICGADYNGIVFKDFIHYGEEPDITPSHTIYLSGCNMRCEFCSNLRFVLNPETGIPLNYHETALKIDEYYKSQKSNNVNFLGGEPTVNLLAILKILSYVNEPVKIIWNSNMYTAPQVFDIILEFADFFLADFKYGNNKCAETVSKTSGYFECVTSNIKKIAKENIIIRHLTLPGHFECCTKPIIEWIAQNMPGVRLSLLNYFNPPHKNSFRSLTPEELKIIKDFASSMEVPVISPHYMDFSDIDPDGSSQIYETEILIRKDGSLVLQDITSDVLKSIKTLTIK